MEISWKWLNLCLGLLLFQLCNGFPINLKDSVADQHTQLLTGLVAVLLTVCSIVLLAGCLCCQRRNGFKEFRDSPVVASAASNLDHGHVNPIANGEFTIFTPLSSSPYNNNVFLANERIITRTAEDFVDEDFDVSSWFNESEKEFPRIKLKYIKELGRGWFGKIVEGAAKEVPPNEKAWTPVVVRILDATASRKERVLFLNEAAIYRCGTHANILSLIGRCLDTVPLLLLQEFCPQGDLKNYLRSKKENIEQLLSTDYPLLWCCQLTSALKHLHNNGVTHPDLATRNCQLTSDLTLKVGDYGLAESKYPEDYYQGSPRVPVRWCSPESLVCTLTTIQPKKTTTETNIWSLGVTIWEICECGEQPYSTLSDDEVVSQVLGPPNVRLSRPSFPVLYTDYLYRLIQLCWTNAESRPTVSQIDLMLSDLWQVYKNTKTNNLSADDFDKRWKTFKPNSVVKDDNTEMEQSGTITKPLSPSLNNLHGSLDNLLDSGELWLDNVTKSDELSFAKSNSNILLSLDDPLVSEISSSDSSDQPVPKQKKSKLKSKIDFDLNTKFRDSNIKQPYNFSDSALFSQRTSSESETEDENWRKKVERGAYTEKVRLKSRSVADLMVLTHVDYSESESETPLPSLDYRVNYKNVRYAPKNNLENVSLTYGSEGNLLSVHNTFQKELKKLKEERRDSLLFVPDNHSQTSFNNLDSNNHNFPLEELTLNDSNLNNMNVMESTSKRLMHELNSVAEIQPANQVFNVFNVTIDKFKPIHVNSCKLNNIINFSDIDLCYTSEQNDKTQMPFEEPKKIIGPSMEESLLQSKNSKNDIINNEKYISDPSTETNLSDFNDDHVQLQSQLNEADLYLLSNGNIATNDCICQAEIQENDENCSTCHDIKPNSKPVGNNEAEIESFGQKENATAEKNSDISPVIINDVVINGLETEISLSNTQNNTDVLTPVGFSNSKILTDDTNLAEQSEVHLQTINDNLGSNLQIATLSDTFQKTYFDYDISPTSPISSRIHLDPDSDNGQISVSKVPEINKKQNLSDVANINELSIQEAREKFHVPKLSEIIQNKEIDCINRNNVNASFGKNFVTETFDNNKLLKQPEIIDINEDSITKTANNLQEPNISNNETDGNAVFEKEERDKFQEVLLPENKTAGTDNFQDVNQTTIKQILPRRKSENASSFISEVLPTESFFNAESNVQVPKLSEIIKSKVSVCNETSIIEEDKYLSNLEFEIDTESQAPRKRKLMETKTFSDVENAVSVTENLNCETHKPIENEGAIGLNDIILTDINQRPESENNFQVPKLSDIILSNQHCLGTEFNCSTGIDAKIKNNSISDANYAYVVPKLSEIIQSKNIHRHLGDGKIDQNEFNSNMERKLTEKHESHLLGDKKDNLESKDTCSRKDIGSSTTDGAQSVNKPTLVTFDISDDQEQIITDSLTHVGVFTSTPASKKLKKYIPSGEAYSSLNLFETPVQKEDNKNLDLFSDLVPLDTSKELNYSLETWDNFLGKTLDAQDVQNENLFDSFSSEPHSVLFVESGNALVQPHKCNEEENINDNSPDVLVNEGGITNLSNVDNRTFIIEDKNEKTFIVDDELAHKDGTFTFNKTDSFESETQDVADNSAWGTGGGWFLHPQTSNKEPSGTIEVRENTDSYVGFGIDDEIMAAIRNELLNKLPHAQVAPSEKVAEVEEWDSSEKNEVFLKYNIYNPPLSPILEESYIEESDIITPKQESDNEDSEWSESGMPEPLPPELESQSVHTYDSQLKGPHHRHTPSQDSCCSNDTLFNLEELTCATGDVEKENDLLKNEVGELDHIELVAERELEKNGNYETTVEEKHSETNVLLNIKNELSDEISEVTTKSETNNNTNDKNLNSTIDYNTDKREDSEQIEYVEVSYDQWNLNSADDQKINISEPTNSEDTNYISEFIYQEIEHGSKQFCRISGGSSSETNSSLEESPIAFKKTQIAPLPSPEDNPWKQLPASLLSYDKVISQNNTLLLPATKSKDIEPEFDDLPKDEDVKEPEYKNLVELSKDCVPGTEDNNGPHYENCNIKDAQPVYENINIEQAEYEDIKEKGAVYENVKDAEPVYQNFTSCDIYNEADYVNIVNLENSKNNAEYVNDKKDYNSVDSDHSESKIIDETNHEDIFGMLTDIKFNGPSDNQLVSTSFSESNDINDEQDWDSGSDTRSSSSGEFIWKEGEHEESLKALRAAPQDMLENIKPMAGIAEESTDESDMSSGTSDEEGEAPEFVPSAWDKFATPTKSALRSPEKSLEISEKNKSKGVWFKKQKYHCVYEYPREPDSPVLQSQDLWKPQLDYSSFTDWEFDADTYFPSTVDDNDMFPSAYNYQPKSISSRNLYQLTSISDFVPSTSGMEDEFFVSSSARPFDVAGGLSSQFFPGSGNWAVENATPDSGMEDSTPGSSTEINECADVKVKNSNYVQSLQKLASEAVQKNRPMSIKSSDALGGLRHTRNKLKLDLPPSPNAFTSTKMFTVETSLEPIIREKPTFTTFGKSRFSVQHVDTPPEESKNRNVSFEALPYKPLKESAKIDCRESCQHINQQNQFLQEKHIIDNKFGCGKGHSEFIRGEASLLDSADEDSGIESSTLERKPNHDGLLQ